LEGRGFNPRPMLDGSGVKAMQGLIPAPNPGSINIRKERKYRLPNIFFKCKSLKNNYII